MLYVGKARSIKKRIAALHHAASANPAASR